MGERATGLDTIGYIRHLLRDRIRFMSTIREDRFLEVARRIVEADQNALNNALTQEQLAEDMRRRKP